MFWGFVAGWDCGCLVIDADFEFFAIKTAKAQVINRTVIKTAVFIDHNIISVDPYVILNSFANWFF